MLGGGTCQAGQLGSGTRGAATRPAPVALTDTRPGRQTHNACDSSEAAGSASAGSLQGHRRRASCSPGRVALESKRPWGTGDGAAGTERALGAKRRRGEARERGPCLLPTFEGACGTTTPPKGGTYSSRSAGVGWTADRLASRPKANGAAAPPPQAQSRAGFTKLPCEPGREGGPGEGGGPRSGRPQSLGCGAAKTGCPPVWPARPALGRAGCGRGRTVAAPDHPAHGPRLARRSGGQLKRARWGPRAEACHGSLRRAQREQPRCLATGLRAPAAAHALIPWAPLRGARAEGGATGGRRCAAGRGAAVRASRTKIQPRNGTAPEGPLGRGGICRKGWVKRAVGGGRAPRVRPLGHWVPRAW